MTDTSKDLVVPFQKRVLSWLMECFSMEVCRDGTERNHRFLEEALELVQSLGCTRSEAHQLVDYVFDRPAGEPMQELGGVQVTLAALCFPHDLNMNEAAERELTRVWKSIEKIRAKQAAKPKHSPLPEPLYAAPSQGVVEALEVARAHIKDEILVAGTARYLAACDVLIAIDSALQSIRTGEGR